MHIQGQGPGFASDASVRGFSSDHSTDLALWIDGVPVNEPVNGHAEGYNDWSLIFPQAIQDLDVIKGPTSALFGNFAFSGIVNVRTLDHLDGTRTWINGGSGRTHRRHIAHRIRQRFERGAASSARATCMRADGVRTATTTSGRDTFASCAISRTTRLIDGGVELYGAQWKSAGYLERGRISAHTTTTSSRIRPIRDTSCARRSAPACACSAATSSGDRRSTRRRAIGGLFLTIPPAGGQFEGVGSQTEEDDNRFGFGATSALTWQLSRAEVTLGAEGRFDQAHYQNWFTTSRVRDSVQALIHAHQLGGGLFAQAGVDVTTRLHVDLGARYDAIDTHSNPDGEESAQDSHGILSPKVGALVKLTNAVGLYANVSRGFRTTDGVIEDPSLPSSPCGRTRVD